MSFRPVTVSHDKKREPKPASTIPWSKYQLAVREEIATGSGHLCVLAFAGSAKTTTIVGALEVVPPGKSVMVAAFNKSIKDELQSKVPDGIEVSTLHSYGLRQLKRAFPELRAKGDAAVDDWKTKNLLREVLPEAFPYFSDTTKSSLCDAVRLAKDTLIAFGDAEAMDALLDTFGIEYGDDSRWNKILNVEVSMDAAVERAEFISFALKLLDESRINVSTVDFSDMCWLPVVRKIPCWQFDYVFIDECLPGYTPVMLADGSSKTIQEIVDTKFSGKVRAFDTKTGRQKNCCVTGWRKILNQRPLVKIQAQWSVRKSTERSSMRPKNFVVCTIDHPIWADGRWVKAGDVKPGMIVQVETAAEKSQRGKITSDGRKVLAKVMTRKNKRGMRKPRKGGWISARGGNGRGLTVPEATLLAELGSGWKPSFVVATKKGRGNGYPLHYKIDIAHPGCRVAVEVDGGSHNSPERREQDRRKEKFLRSLGWTVFRVPNRAAVQNTKEEAAKILSATNCPIDAKVISVEPISIPDFYVYDIEVEDCHNFYANGILVHNCQDLNAAQIELALRAGKPNGRIVAVGDIHQGIYFFRGADSNAIPNLIKRLKAKVLPLPICYRCATSIVAVAQEIVPDFQAQEGKEAGTVTRLSDTRRLLTEAAPGDFILSRTNAPLLPLCFELLRQGKPATIAGRDVAASLSTLVKKAQRKGVKTVTELEEFLTAWAKSESEKMTKAGKDPQIILDRAACVRVFAEECSSIDEVLFKIERIFSREEDPSRPNHHKIVLSTTHKAKGLERERVWVLADTYRRSSVEEKNLFYVAVTRAKSDLFLIYRAKEESE